MRRLLCSTGTMVERDNGYDIATALANMMRFYAEGLISGGELMMLEFFYDKEERVTDAVRESGVPFPVIHCEKKIGDRLSEAGAGHGDDAEAMELFCLNCDFGRRIGARSIVLHLWGGRDSDSHFEYNASRVPLLLDIAEAAGLRLLVENIPCTTATPLEHWRALEAYLPRVGFIFDTRFGEFHDQIRDILGEKKLWETGAVSHMHISDYGGAVRDFTKLRPILHPGEGHVDFAAIARGLDENSYDGTITLESPVMSAAGLDTDKLRRSLAFVRDTLSAH